MGAVLYHTRDLAGDTSDISWKPPGFELSICTLAYVASIVHAARPSAAYHGLAPTRRPEPSHLNQRSCRPHCVCKVSSYPSLWNEPKSRRLWLLKLHERAIVEELFAEMREMTTKAPGGWWSGLLTDAAWPSGLFLPSANLQVTRTGSVLAS